MYRTICLYASMVFPIYMQGLEFGCENFLSPKAFNMGQHGRSHLVRPPKRRLSAFMLVPGIGKSTMASSNMTLKMTLKVSFKVIQGHQSRKIDIICHVIYRTICLYASMVFPIYMEGLEFGCENFLSPKAFNMGQHGRSHLVRPPKRRLSAFMLVPGIGKSTMASSNMTLKMTLKVSFKVIQGHQSRKIDIILKMQVIARPIDG